MKTFLQHYKESKVAAAGLGIDITTAELIPDIKARTATIRELIAKANNSEQPKISASQAEATDAKNNIHKSSSKDRNTYLAEAKATINRKGK